MIRPTRRAALRLAALLLLPLPARAADPTPSDPDPADWPGVLAQARGQTVRFHAWGGDARINGYIDWAGREAERLLGVRVVQVKLADTADAVSRIVAEKAAGRAEDGAVDLVWINGENFATLRRGDLLYGPWAEALPNWALVDVAGKPAVTADFTVPTEGFEAPWSMAQVVFYHDAARLPDPPRSMPALLAWAEARPGRFAFPQPPDFLGTTFLKQALLGLVSERAPFALPPAPGAAEALSAPLWAFLDRLTPLLWRGGAVWPANGPRLRQLMADGEIDLALAFGAGGVAGAVAAFELPDTVRSFSPEGGGLGNASFVAIPFNAPAKAGAMAFADFLLSPAAQARKADPTHWGADTVLDVARLKPAERALFDAIPVLPGGLAPEAVGPSLPEPHPDWTPWLEAEWARRYGAGE